jgi:hypothetical protein
LLCGYIAKFSLFGSTRLRYDYMSKELENQELVFMLKVPNGFF